MILDSSMNMAYVCLVWSDVLAGWSKIWSGFQLSATVVDVVMHQTGNVYHPSPFLRR